MASQVANPKAIMVMTRDYDIPIISGVCCIAIKGFTKGQYKIVCLSEATLKNVMKNLSNQSQAKFQQAENPFFDGVSNYRFQVLVMLILGCDVYLTGMKGVKIGKLEPQIESINTTSEKVLYQRLYAIFDTYIDAIMYKLTNPMPEIANKKTPAKTYLFGALAPLPKYLKQFSVDK